MVGEVAAVVVLEGLEVATINGCMGCKCVAGDDGVLAVGRQWGKCWK